MIPICESVGQILCPSRLSECGSEAMELDCPGACVGATEESAVHLNGLGDSLSVNSAEWGVSPEVAMEVWFRPERRARDDHEEQCILSQGSWQGRFKLSVLPWRVLRFTVTFTKLCPAIGFVRGIDRCEMIEAA